jgi:hypothetical protein
METHMANKKLTPDYLNLPYEVHFACMNSIGYELMHKAGKPPKKLKDYKVIEVRQGRVFDVTFRSDNLRYGELLWIMSGNMDEVIPEWFEMISGEDHLEITWARRSKFRIKDQVMRMDGSDENDYDDYEYGEKSTFDYVAEGFRPDYIILDSDDSRIKIDLQGFRLSANNKILGRSPFLVISEERAYDFDVGGKEEYDIIYEIARWFD